MRKTLELGHVASFFSLKICPLHRKKRKREKNGIFSDTCHSRIVDFFYFYFFFDFKDKFRLELILLKPTLKKRNKQFVKFPFVKISIDVVVVVNADKVVAIVVNVTKKIQNQNNQISLIVLCWIL